MLLPVLPPFLVWAFAILFAVLGADLLFRASAQRNRWLKSSGLPNKTWLRDNPGVIWAICAFGLVLLLSGTTTLIILSGGL